MLVFIDIFGIKKQHLSIEVENDIKTNLYKKTLRISTFHYFYRAIMSEVGENTNIVDGETPALKSGIGNVVASHYNNLQERGKAARTESRWNDG